MNGRDLLQLEELLAGADRVVSMREIWEGEIDPDVVGMRHDVDDNAGSLETAVKIAEWEAERGYRSTFFMLHSASYFESSRLAPALERIAELGHEVGIHANAIATALRVVDADPDEILADGIGVLRELGHEVVGVAAHGDELCRRSGFVNDEQFVECARPEMGAPDRVVTFGEVRVKLAPRPFADFGLLYDTHRLPHGRYLSDSGGSWNEALPGLGAGQLHMLVHPDWWSPAFTTAKVVA